MCFTLYTHKIKYHSHVNASHCVCRFKPVEFNALTVSKTPYIRISNISHTHTCGNSHTYMIYDVSVCKMRLFIYFEFNIKQFPGARNTEPEYKVFFGFIMRRCAQLKRMYKHYEINFPGRTAAVVTAECEGTRCISICLFSEYDLQR